MCIVFFLFILFLCVSLRCFLADSFHSQLLCGTYYNIYYQKFLLLQFKAAEIRACTGNNYAPIPILSHNIQPYCMWMEMWTHKSTQHFKLWFNLIGVNYQPEENQWFWDKQKIENQKRINDFGIKESFFWSDYEKLRLNTEKNNKYFRQNKLQNTSFEIQFIHLVLYTCLCEHFILGIL